MTDNEKMQYALILMDKGAIYRNGRILPDVKSEDNMALEEVSESLVTTLLLLGLVTYSSVIEPPEQWSGYAITEVGRAAVKRFARLFEISRE